MSNKNKFNVGDVVIVKSWNMPPFLAVLADAGERRQHRVRVVNHEFKFDDAYYKDDGVMRRSSYYTCPYTPVTELFKPTPENLAAMNHLYGTNLTLSWGDYDE